MVTLPSATIDPELREWFARIGGVVIPLGAPSRSDVDADETYRKWFADRGVVAALQRPDFVLFGTAADAAGAPGLVRALRDVLQNP